LTSEKQIIQELISSYFRSWFIDFDPVKTKVNGELPYGMNEEIAALFPDSFEDSEIGLIPKGWRVGSISEYGRIITGRTPSSKNPEHFNGEIPFITIPDLNQNIWQDETARTLSKSGAEALKNSLLPSESVCVSCIATVGCVGITTTPSITNQQIHSIICDKGYSSLFVYSLMKSYIPNLKWFAGGGAVVQNISKTGFGKQRVIIPPKSIVECYLNLTRPTYNLLRKRHNE
jgi:type I restriction enzyme, S subunit